MRIKLFFAFFMMFINVGSVFAITTENKPKCVHINLSIKDSFSNNGFPAERSINNNIALCNDNKWVELGGEYNYSSISDKNTVKYQNELSLMLGKLVSMNNNMVSLSFMIIDHFGENQDFIANPKIILPFNKDKTLLFKQDDHLIKINLRFLSMDK
jgi:hypothetical protein